jgi:hypothetical protein
MAKTPEEMLKAMIENLPKTTGKSLDQWRKIVAATKLTKHGEIVKHLKAEYGIGHGYANQIAQRALAPAEAEDRNPTAMLDAQYAGAKSSLRPIFDAIAAAAKQLGKDVEISPKKTYVSLRCSKQFAIVQPSTATRVDVGLCLKGTPATPRLEPAGSFNAMVSHRVRIESAAQVDAELKAWLHAAYTAALGG